MFLLSDQAQVPAFRAGHSQGWDSLDIFSLSRGEILLMSINQP